MAAIGAIHDSAYHQPICDGRTIFILKLEGG
jgi:hypothetical protein